MRDATNNSDDLCFIVQARLASTRLPSKIFMDFYNGCSLFDLLIDKLSVNFPEIPVIIATSKNKENDLIEQKASDKNISVYRGSENDVLQRFIDAAESYDKKNIIRICSDNPFLDVEELKKLIEFVSENGFEYDYVSFMVNGSPSIKTHFGFWTEFVKTETLKDVVKRTDEELYHEHVTNYIYAHPEYYKLFFLDPPTTINGRNDIRMTLDTKEDFSLLQKIYKEMRDQHGVYGFSLNDVVNYLDTRGGYRDYMIKQIQQNTK